MITFNIYGTELTGLFRIAFFSVLEESFWLWFSCTVQVCAPFRSVPYSFLEVFIILQHPLPLVSPPLVSHVPEILESLILHYHNSLARDKNRLRPQPCHVFWCMFYKTHFLLIPAKIKNDTTTQLLW